MSRSALAELDPWRSFSTMTKISYAGYRFPREIIHMLGVMGGGDKPISLT
jgi:hypothetical protein